MPKGCAPAGAGMRGAYLEGRLPVTTVAAFEGRRSSWVVQQENQETETPA
jgi:hypothetical protein